MKLKNWAQFMMCLTIATLMTACKSTEPVVTQGIQPKYHALNPSRILAVPIFLIPNPVAQAIVDQGDLEVARAIPQLESLVLGAFAGQPAVNGISFNAVRRELGASPNAWDRLNSLLGDYAKRFATPLKIDLNPLPELCFDSRSFVDFYALCAAPQTTWKAALNTLSAKVFNADSALLIFVNHARKHVVESVYQTEAQISVILIDTNNANVIWSRSETATLPSPADKKSFPPWPHAFETIINEKFWLDFPGRTPKSEN